MKGTPTTRSPFVIDSPFEIIIRTTFGIYGHVDSEVATLTISDPCVDTELISQSLQDMIVELNAEQPETQDFPLFKDTISVLYSDLYGNGSQNDICAPQEYEIIDSSTGQPALFAFVAINENTQTGVISVQTNDIEDIGTYDLLLRVSLPDYDKVVDVPFKLTIE